jgi:hypothetical protein
VYFQLLGCLGHSSLTSYALLSAVHATTGSY